MQIQFASIMSALQTRKTKPDRMHNELIHYWRWIETGLAWNVSVCVVASLQFCPISATMQRPVINVGGIGKNTPTSCSYHMIIWGTCIIHYPNPLSKFTVRTRSKLDWNQFQQWAFNLDPIQLQCGQVFSRSPTRACASTYNLSLRVRGQLTNQIIVQWVIFSWFSFWWWESWRQNDLTQSSRHRFKRIWLRGAPGIHSC